MYGKKLIDFIAKDTGDQNESKKLIVVLRVLILSLLSYYAIHTVMAVIYMAAGAWLVFASVVVFFAALFALSYHLHTRQVLVGFQIGILVLVWIMVRNFSWNVGVQHFLTVLLILTFFSSYKQYFRKIVSAICLCGVRLGLYYLYRHAIPVWDLSPEVESILQVMNTVIAFWCISVISFIFSNASQELEGKLVEYNNYLELQANTDTLTKLYNRRWAGERLAEMSKNPEEYGEFSICICDIDFFKKVNDNYGHDFGDEVLRAISAIFRREMKNNGFAARWGGEEFLLVFTSCNGDEAYIKLENIRRLIKALQVTKEDTTVSVTMTFGLVEYDFFNGIEKTINQADKKLYMGKESGRDVIIY